MRKEFSVKINFLCKAAEKLSSELIKTLGKDYWLSIIGRVKEIAKILNESLDGGESWRVSQIYSALQLYEEYYDEVCNMANHGFSIWESEIKTILEKTYYRTALKDNLKEYIAKHKIGERVDEYKKHVRTLEG